MSAVTLTTDYQLAIPEEMRKDVYFQPGTRFEVFISEGVIKLIPIRPISEMRGFLTMKDTEIERDEEDRL